MTSKIDNKKLPTIKMIFTTKSIPKYFPLSKLIKNIGKVKRGEIDIKNFLINLFSDLYFFLLLASVIFLFIIPLIFTHNNIEINVGIVIAYIISGVIFNFIRFVITK